MNWRSNFINLIASIHLIVFSTFLATTDNRIPHFQEGERRAPSIADGCTVNEWYAIKISKAAPCHMHGHSIGWMDRGILGGYLTKKHIYHWTSSKQTINSVKTGRKWNLKTIIQSHIVYFINIVIKIYNTTTSVILLRLIKFSRGHSSN